MSYISSEYIEEYSIFIMNGHIEYSDIKDLPSKSQLADEIFNDSDLVKHWYLAKSPDQNVYVFVGQPLQSRGNRNIWIKSFVHNQ